MARVISLLIILTSALWLGGAQYTCVQWPEDDASGDWTVSVCTPDLSASLLHANTIIIDDVDATEFDLVVKVSTLSRMQPFRELR